MLQVFPQIYYLSMLILFVQFSSISVQFNSVQSLSPTLCDPMNCNMPGYPVHHQLLEIIQTHVNWVGDAIQPSHPLPSPLLLHLQSFPASGSFPMSRFFPSCGQSIGVSASASVLPMNTQDWSALGLTGWISLQSKRWFCNKHPYGEMRPPPNVLRNI